VSKPGQLIVVKGAKTSDYKGLTVVGYENTTSVYLAKQDQLKTVKRVQDVVAWY
jgi:hypothetical protein